MKNLVNRSKLNKLMKEKNLNYSDIGKILGISRSSISRKMAEQIRFTEDEITQLVKLFGRQILNL